MTISEVSRATLEQKRVVQAVRVCDKGRSFTASEAKFSLKCARSYF